MPEGQEPNGAPSQNTQETPSPEPTQPGPAPAAKTFTEDYVKELRTEAATWRSKVRELEARVTEQERGQLTEQERIAKERDDFKTRYEGLSQTVRQQSLRAAVVSEAAKLNAVEPEAIVAIVQAKGVEFDEDGTPKDVAGVLRDVQKAFPGLFRAPNAPAGSADGGAVRNQDPTPEPTMGVGRIRVALEQAARKAR